MGLCLNDEHPPALSSPKARHMFFEYGNTSTHFRAALFVRASICNAQDTWAIVQYADKARDAAFPGAFQTIATSGKRITRHVKPHHTVDGDAKVKLADLAARQANDARIFGRETIATWQRAMIQFMMKLEPRSGFGTSAQAT